MVLGGPTHHKHGLAATLIAFASIIAADVGAYAGGKTFGRTKLSSEYRSGALNVGM